MGKNRQITHMEKFQTIHVATAPSDMGYAQRFSSRIYYCGKKVGGGKKPPFYSGENLTNTTSARSSSSLTLSVINHVESRHSFFFPSHCTVCGTSPTRDWPCAHCSGSPESQPLDQQALLVQCENATLLYGLPPKDLLLNIIMREIKTEGHSTKETWPGAPKLSGSPKIRKVWETVTAKRT